MSSYAVESNSGYGPLLLFLTDLRQEQKNLFWPVHFKGIL